MTTPVAEATAPNWVKLNLAQLTTMKKMHETNSDFALSPVFNTLKPDDKLLVKKKLVLISQLIDTMRQLHDNNVT